MPRPIKLSTCLMTVFLLSSCAPVAEDEVLVTETVQTGGPESDDGTEAGLADIELCDAAVYRALVGAGIADTAFPDDPKLRVFGENDIVTQDYRPDRTNVLYDAGGTIIRVYCG